MYPYLRFAYHLMKAARAPRQDPFDAHVLHTRVWPQDLDPWLELNNGRTLSLYDLGRIAMFKQAGLSDLMAREGWRGTVAGVSVRYRKRVTLWSKVRIHTRLAGLDHRFVYTVQSMWAGDTCTSQVLMRSAILENGRMIPMSRVAEALNHDRPLPELPAWVSAWIEAEDTRPWPPEE